MKSIFVSTIATSLFCASIAAADGVETSPAAPRTVRAYHPNVPLIVTGGVLFLGVYVPSVIIAIESSNDADRRLAIPILGPWLDFAERGGCPITTFSCDKETGNKVLLAGDGILQAIGTVAVVTGFLTSDRMVATSPRSTIRFAPMHMGRGSSIAAGLTGTF
jgi:hypothetical protein